ncbi:MAG TPA: DUF2232 domain-containing protein [Dehalococcoidia bacterium]
MLGDLAVLIVLIGLYVPYAGPALATISPIPFLLLLVRRGWRVAIESAVVAALLVTFLTGPFSAFAVGTLFLRGASLGIGLRRGWRVSRTIVAGTAFLWVFLWLGVTAWAIAIPSWRSATEHGISLTLHQGANVAGAMLGLLGLGVWWHQIDPQINDFIAWVLRYWLYLLPLVAWPVLLLAETAEYLILEVILPRFGIQPPPFRFPWQRPAAHAARRHPAGLRGRLERWLSSATGRAADVGADRHVARLARRMTAPPRPVPQEVEAINRGGRDGDGRWSADSRPRGAGVSPPAEKTRRE